MVTTESELVLYNIAYRAGLIYEDITYLRGEDIFGDSLEPLSALED
jgi:hypothetical protein